jgi:hypothetical protein
MSNSQLNELSSHDSPNVYLYNRCSTAEQSTGDSLNRQRLQGTAYAAKKGYIIPEENIIEDVGLSGFTGENLKSGKLGVSATDVANGKIPSGSIFLVESTMIKFLSVSYYCTKVLGNIQIVLLGTGHQQVVTYPRPIDVLHGQATLMQINASMCQTVTITRSNNPLWKAVHDAENVSGYIHRTINFLAND